MAAQAQAFTEEMITKAWKNSGIHPLDPHIFTNKDFAPSMATSTEAHVPPSFPIQPSQLYLYQDILPSCDDAVKANNIDSMDESKSNSDVSGSKSNSETSNSGSESSKESKESEMDEDVVDEDQHSHVQITVSPPSNSPNQPSMQVQIAVLEAKVKSLESELHSTKAHCAMALSEVGLMKKQLNKWQKRHGHEISMHWWLTSVEGLRQCEEQDMAREAKAEKKVQVVAQKALKQASRLAQQATQGSNICFTGALSIKSKEDLIDIANQLTIKTTGTKAELLKVIREYFDAHADLKNDT
ncbi:uncharacterized protein EDB91DRAFT_1255529 [Suillus paluster]|uniref:uncharacterized protein n=1 Tax=Suillus paluster TaxID=48578 RepID=UPI001B85F2BD|nr:uncharacterized protein EDB91DRAFT_1255529 [Suillus paluster]KAG1723713.1 hypothetical protein EDB91DRAFT_1255529 [Suillus paluster]